MTKRTRASLWLTLTAAAVLVVLAGPVRGQGSLAELLRNVVINSVTLTANRIVLGNGTSNVTVLGSLGSTTTVLHGNAAGAPTFGAVSLTADVTGVLPVANFATGTPNGAKFVRDDGVLAAPPSASGMTQLSQIVTSASQASVDFTSISGSYSSLLVTYLAQADNAGTSSDNLRLKINNDGTAGNYTATSRMGSQNAVATAGAAIAASTLGFWVGDIPNAGNTSMGVTGQILINQYAGTAFHKTFLASWHSESASFISLYQSAGRWKSTAAITQLTFDIDTGAFTNGSVFTLYGVP